MNHAVAVIDVVALLAGIAAIVLLVRGWRARQRLDVKLTLGILLAVTAFCQLSNALEWSKLTAALDQIEDHLEILEPVLWGVLLYAFLQSLAERSLRESENRYRSLVENINLGITLIDRNHRIVATNAVHAGLYGKGADTLIGTACYHEFEKRSTPCPHCPGTRAMATQRPASAESEGVRDDGSRIPVRIQAFPVLDASGEATGFIEVVEDITARRQTEEERARLEAQLRQSQKMEAVGQLAGGVAHDFNNILTTILGNVELATNALQDTLPEDSPVLQELLQVEQAARRAATLTQRLLVFSRRDAARPIVLDVNKAVADMERLLRRLISEDILLEVKCAPGLHRIQIDASQLEQIVINLVVNARDAMRDGGQLTLEATNVVLDQSHADAHADARQGPHVLLTVSDTGCGMAPETLERLFEPFFTTKEPGQGTGLGLATVHGIVSQAGGHITVHSELRQGTTFRVYLPAAEAPTEHAVRRADDHALVGGAETVLICEDEDTVRQLTAQMLRSAGYTVLAASSGEQALELAAQHDRPVQLLITDVIMPGMNGKKLAETLRARHPELRTLFVSGYTANVIAHHGVLDKGIEFLEKPFTRRLLLERVRAVLDRAPP